MPTHTTPRANAVQWCYRNSCRNTSHALHASMDAMFAGVAANHPSVVSSIPSSWLWDKLCDPETAACGPFVPGARGTAWST